MWVARAQVFCNIHRSHKANARIYAYTCTMQKELVSEGHLLKPGNSQASANETGQGAGVLLTPYKASQCQQLAETHVGSLGTSGWSWWRVRRG